MTKAAQGVGSIEIPFVVGAAALFLLFWAGFIVWWSLMSMLFSRSEYLAAVGVAYALPTIYTLVAFLASNREGYYVKLSHFFSYFAITVVNYLVLSSNGGSVLFDSAGYLGMALIASVMAIMQYPKAGLRHYEVYRPSLFIGGVIFMPLFIYLAAMLPNVPHTPSLDKTYLFPIGMLGFWLSGAWLVFRRTQGKYVPGLEVKPLMPFRPDFILPGGVTFVKGVVMMGVGLMIMIHPQLGMPRWNWWGFVLAFWGIITLIPLRGMYKMVKGRRMRLLGKGGVGYKAEFYKDMILFIGLNMLLYGFVNAFFGTTPFMELGVKPEYNSLVSRPATGWLGLGLFALSFVVLVVIRGWYKTQLLEGVETWRQRLGKQTLLYLGTLLLLMAYIHLLYLPPIRGAGYLWFYPDTNPVGLAVGLALFVVGSLLILVFRPIALRNELEATMMTMVGAISDSPEELRRWVLENRIATLLSMPEPQRDAHVRMMIAGLSALPEENKKRMLSTQMNILSGLSSDERGTMMKSMDKVMFAGGE